MSNPRKNPTFHAHTSTLADGETNPDKSTWEPLFTPWHDRPGHDLPSDPSIACSGKNGEHCPHCENLEPQHGHLNKVAYLCAKFAAEMLPYGSDRELLRQWGYITGLWHDLGKFNNDFQAKLEGENISVEHAGAGAVLAKNLFEPYLEYGTHHYPLAAAIAGHHAGLSNFRDQGSGKSTPLLQRLKNNHPLSLDWSAETERELSQQVIPKPPSCCETNNSPEFSLPFFTRMIFSCLVDADSLVTEALEKGSRAFEYSAISTLSKRLDKKLTEFETTPQDPRKQNINKQRKRILTACQLAADQPSGAFSLNVPTGGGKTLSGMSFALRHAIHSGHQRVIILAPYTTIIEQTADEYRKYLGVENIIEHHSNLDDFSDSETQTEADKNKQLAAENWDAPVIVTTTVQFFESLFANKRGRCRKLHNIANSTIILDEAQCLPTSYLDPTLRAMRELVEHYHCSIVLSTATQPAFKQRKKFPHGFPTITPILPESLTYDLHQDLTRNRVSVTWNLSEAMDINAITNLFQDTKADQKLIVVNTRKEASAIFEELQRPAENHKLFHLSTNLCAAHRKEKLREIKYLLDEKSPCTVVSTQLIECGVDHSYQRVIRSLAGYDSIAQSAGRCNRHGEIQGGGEFIVYKSEAQLHGFLRNCAAITQTIIGESPPSHLADLSLYDQYFRHLYQAGAGRDTSDVLQAYEQRNLEDVAMRYKLIEDYKAFTVVIPWEEEGEARLEKVRNIIRSGNNLSRGYLRSLQPYTVSLSHRDFETVKPYTEPLLDGGFSHFIHPQSLDQIYSNDLGVKLHSESQSYLGCHE